MLVYDSGVFRSTIHGMLLATNDKEVFIFMLLTHLGLLTRLTFSTANSYTCAVSIVLNCGFRFVQLYHHAVKLCKVMTPGGSTAVTH